jgi:hypothetical protein
MNITDTYIGMFITNNPTTGEPRDADSTPTVTVFKNGQATDSMGMTVNEVISNPSNDQGVYNIIAAGDWADYGFSSGDKVDIHVYATINSIDSHGIVDSFILNNGVILDSSGLDNVSTSEPSGRASNFREMVVQLYQRFFNKVTLDNSNLKVRNSSGSVVTTQAASDTGSKQTLGKA